MQQPLKKDRFRTLVPIPEFSWKIGYRDQLLLMGSCFSKHMGERLGAAQFDVCINTHGILFNPLSLVHALSDLMGDKVYTETDLISDMGLFHSMQHHGSFSAIRSAEVLKNINNHLEKGRACLEKLDVLIITLGSAFAYREKSGGQVVANCHKLDAGLFDKILIAHDQIVEAFSESFKNLFTRRPNLRILITVSPVRHWKDGALENNLSKSHLRIAVDELQSLFDNVHYFPAFEIFMDELRDYRFYAEDMLHPSESALDYMWERFCMAFFNEQTDSFFNRIQKAKLNLDHRPLYPESTASLAFEAKAKSEWEALMRRLESIRSSKA